jgi:N-acetylneuraminic acid mutarotase
MLTPRDHLAVAAVGCQLYAIGWRIGNDPQNNLNVNEAYNQRTDTWEPRTPMPTARGGIAAAVLEGKIYVFGGEGQGTVFGEVEVYDPQQNSWRRCTPMPTPRHGLGAVAIGGRI